MMASDFSSASLVSGFVKESLQVSQINEDHTCADVSGCTKEKNGKKKRSVFSLNCSGEVLCLQRVQRNKAKANDDELYRVPFTCVDAKLLMKFSNTQEK